MSAGNIVGNDGGHCGGVCFPPYPVDRRFTSAKARRAWESQYITIVGLYYQTCSRIAEGIRGRCCCEGKRDESVACNGGVKETSRIDVCGADLGLSDSGLGCSQDVDRFGQRGGTCEPSSDISCGRSGLGVNDCVGLRDRRVLSGDVGEVGGRDVTREANVTSSMQSELGTSLTEMRIAENKLRKLKAERAILLFDNSEERINEIKVVNRQKFLNTKSRVQNATDKRALSEFNKDKKMIADNWRASARGTGNEPPSAVNSIPSIGSTEISSGSSASRVENVCSSKVKSDVMKVLTCSDLSVRAKGSDLSVVVTKQGKRTKSTGVSIARDYVRLPAWIKNRYEPEVISAASPVDKLLIQLKAITEKRPVTPEPLDSDCYFE